MQLKTLGNQLLGLCLLAAFALPFAPLAAQAAPCELKRNEFGVWVGDCTTEDIFGDTIVVNRAVFDPLPIRLPDLYADDGDYFVNGMAVEVTVRVGNMGQWRSGDFDVTATIDIRRPNGTVYNTVSLTGRSNGIDVGQRTYTFVGVVTLPDRVNDWDLHTRFAVDSNGMTSGGEVWELNESNNVFDDGICRVYGQDPDTSVRACL